MTDPAAPLTDNHGRTVRYLRLSLTGTCNFRCGFCVPEDQDTNRISDGTALTTHELLRLCRVFHSLGVDRFKITGGEPFLAPDVFDIIQELKTEAATVTVTTNGSTLGGATERLAALGVDGVNVSLNAMSQKKYARLTGIPFPLPRLLDSVLQARNAGLRPKLNMVPLRDVNEDDILPLLEFGLANDIPVRFIELMPLGQGRHHHGLSFGEVRARIESRFGPTVATDECLGNGPARYLSLPGHAARIGYIAAVSEGFCTTCNRIRLSRAGFVRTCLHHNHGTDLAGPLRAGMEDEAIAARIREAVANKPESHRFGEHRDDLGREPMFRIGG